MTVAVKKFFDGMRKGEYLPNKEQRATKDVADLVFIVSSVFAHDNSNFMPQETERVKYH